MAREARTRVHNGILDAERLKHCFECGICTASCPVVELFPNHYNPRSLLQKTSLNIKRVLKENGLWLCAWCYRCYRRCPQRVRVPEVLVSVKDLATEQGHLRGFEEALGLIRREVPLPTVCCYVCFHPERGRVDKPPVFTALKRFATDHEHEEEVSPVPKTREKKIAVIGSGPAGLTAAHDLVKKGYSVTVFESLPKPGGMLRIGLPEYRLPKSVLDAEIEHLKDQGMEIRTNLTVGRDVTINELLREGYKAIFIAVGAQNCRKLDVEGEELKGVVQALDLLRKVNLGHNIELGKKVAVIGGGNVAMDAARTALQLGAKDVNVFCMESQEEMPANPWEVREAEDSGVNMIFSVTPKRMLGKDGRVVATEFVSVELGELDESGMRCPVPIEGSGFTVELDAVILAIGAIPDLSLLPKDIEVAIGNTIVVDLDTLETSLAGVFAGGDVVSGPATVIEAVVAGKRAAVSIDRYLRGEDPTTGERI
ncbi:MAG: FAD-dependent oxidoreductase [Candidatus Bathyarchaeota archaeon]|nr:FAD-dependent oxidoreductase [Candidatus Bathyarchaeota archaeon]